ncbi:MULTISPECIES: Crp/Fnr family transcriptional regulator [Lysinibacillus]|uniref:CRP/FNR family transcriptional regulator, anaerobic regulatory protein n=1 Tax=Lysinibacillus fusiformis TaxID=28031 RepID=A0A1H9P3F4_9BACI|nr:MULTISPECIES: Crp/Fnr family transcriptional regulator [Lysinibacillus]MCG7436960.1 Crp/Fnr family transcriptional regulator [Lysinibacillus fusiformis]MED4671805.1 Crp/Fnr family transcriptional regulator [Lysinibacillus fusiformis]NOG30388.1 Crp/Fnr family transcriptional regulator [Lysinibacillus fusiformis]PCD81405.1 Crp/Fnr family transcriptional regulator [Lysinibacillus fusiformis]QAS57461.1 Crp/Fnr family transcriptional regulator [Lysinibacillus sphaericus]
MDNIQYLSQFNLLNSLSMEDLIEMEQLTLITTFPKNTFIQTPETFSEGLYFVKRGKLRLYKVNAQGKQFTSDILNEGNVFGEMDIISFGTRENYIETIEESHICLMNKERFENFLIQRPQFMMTLLKVLSNRIIGMSQLTQNLALGKLHDKVLYALIKLSDQFGLTGDNEYYKIDFPLSHQEIANLVGATREAVTVVLQELVKEEVIKTGFKTIYIHREKLLERNIS